MTVEEITLQLLNAALPQVETFIEKIPQGFKGYPCLLINEISERSEKCQSGDSHDEAVIQVSAIALTPAQAAFYKGAIRTALDHVKGTFGDTVVIGFIYKNGNVTSDFDEGQFFTKTLDFTILIQK